ncbi:hypothetical protein QJ850_gp100 [Acanthamoeba polyphaga mimivirus]|uniref:Uncharacterized protein n=1 Tax=Acanthamoeba polyphaga mimivirus Kroon TaxID=3069720 RepID=A0A0G2Y7S1_9VIRU|nr:hypothetical protein QJ850_gp100 [Acanthamoeba polyphaga mimivirus]AKI80599.1 hypothetical protein [Acanthamoeba polyphaga mimivirus Kroon]
MEKYTVCLCGDYCPSKKDVLEYCQVIDNDYYIVINDELLPVIFDKYVVSEPEFFYEEYDCVVIDFENILKFNDFMANEHLLDVVYLRKTLCNNFEFVTDYLEYITKNNITKHIKYYLKKPYYNKICWNNYLQEKIFKYSDVSTIRSCLKYLTINHIDKYFHYSLSRNDNIILDYLIDKMKIYLTSYFTGKKYKGNMFKITNNDKLVDIPDIYSTLYYIVCFNKKNENVIEIYRQAIDRFQELLESQENINVKEKLIPEHRRLKLKLTYNEKIKNRLLCFLLVDKNGKPLLIVKQLLMDGANIYTINRNNGFTFLDHSIEIIIKNKNLDLLDILFEMKLIDQTELNFILEKSTCKINFEYDAELDFDEKFVIELSGYGADVDEHIDKLIKNAKKYNNNKLVDCLKNLKN